MLTTELREYKEIIGVSNTPDLDENKFMQSSKMVMPDSSYNKNRKSYMSPPTCLINVPNFMEKQKRFKEQRH